MITIFQRFLVDQRIHQHLVPSLRIDALYRSRHKRFVHIEGGGVIFRQIHRYIRFGLLPGERNSRISKETLWNIVVFQICMSLSAIYHTFNCRSCRDCDIFLTFDLFGIALSLLAIYTSGIYYAFWCDSVSIKKNSYGFRIWNGHRCVDSRTLGRTDNVASKFDNIRKRMKLI